MKNDRQLKILEIISREDIRTQEDLILALQREGYRATQATVSRDIKELHLQKVANSDGVIRYAVASATAPSEKDTQNKYKQVLQQVLTSAVPAGNIAVVKTLSGTASAAAAALETLAFSEIIGTLAGDDTLLCIFADHRLAFSFCRMLNQDFIQDN